MTCFINVHHQVVYFPPVKNVSLLYLTCFKCLDNLAKLNPDSLPGTGALVFVYCFRVNQIHSALIPIHVSPLQSCASSRLHAAQLGNRRCNPDVHFLLAPPPISLFFFSLPLLPVSHAKLHLAQMHANTVPAAEERISKLHKKKNKKTKQVRLKRAVLFLRLWEGPSYPELVVKSCLHKSEVMFFVE